MITGLSHVAVVARDFDRSLAFYRDVIGLEVVAEFNWAAGEALFDYKTGIKDSAARVAILKLPLGNGFVELMRFASTSEAETGEAPRLDAPGFGHLAFEVDDAFAEYERLKAKGMRFLTEPSAPLEGAPVTVYGFDPDGNHIELQSALSPESPYSMLSLRLPAAPER